MTPEDHKLLGETGPGTPMGEMLRRYWMPAVLSREIEADGAPVRVRLLEEDLVAFRDSQGRPGLLREFCAHRGASLYFGRNEDCGLRCWYHGWKYDVEGNCVDMPNQPVGRSFADKVKQRAYPCIERNGVVWTCLGPEGQTHDLPDLEWNLVPEDHVYVSKRIQQCNWLQGLEGDIDSSHLGFLHGATIARTEEHAGYESAEWMEDDAMPIIEIESLKAGIMLGSRRNAGPDAYFWRINQWFYPNFTTIPGFAGDGPLTGHSWAPLEQGKSAVYTFTWHPTRPLTEEERARMRKGTAVHVRLIPGTFTPLCNKSNEYADPDAGPEKQPWMRIKEFQDQDICITESMGPLYDRTQENLGASDTAIMQVRRRLMDAARALEKDGTSPPPGDAADYRIRPVSVKLPRSNRSWAESIADAISARPETFQPSV